VTTYAIHRIPTNFKQQKSKTRTIEREKLLVKSKKWLTYLAMEQPLANYDHGLKNSAVRSQEEIPNKEKCFIKRKPRLKKRHWEEEWYETHKSASEPEML